MKSVCIRRLALVMVMALLPATGQGQGNLSGGLRAGIGLMRMGGDATKDTDIQGKAGICAGAFVEIGINDNIALQSEALYVVKGLKTQYILNDGVNDGTIEESNELSYIEFPVLLKFRLPTGGKIKPHLFAGPAVAISIGGTSEGTNIEGNLFPWDGSDYGWDGDIANRSTVDFSGIIGAGLEVPIGKLTAVFDLRYDYSFRSAFDDIDNYGTPSYDPGDEIPLVSDDMGTAADLKNRMAAVSIGLIFPL